MAAKRQSGDFFRILLGKVTNPNPTGYHDLGVFTTTEIAPNSSMKSRQRAFSPGRQTWLRWICAGFARRVHRWLACALARRQSLSTNMLSTSGTL
jgi:hypothetical protein